ncbi:MAG: TIGR04283 family arsenosugar biosynthesis glycosyltransferase [Candidatus Binatia bacterium]|nr:TIGR04283 family arsenosugar biosynthesis glycosyltransferase [Candidatus Binatia bacterium]
MGAEMRVSVIIPTLNEAPGIVETLRQVRQAGECEILVVDGGSEDGTPELARPLADVVLVSKRGRARQMNAGARAAAGDVLLFLHADTRLPLGFPAIVAQSLDDPRVVGGRFDVRLDAAGWPFRMIERLMNIRSRWTKIATGDQALFVRREVFLALGGYPDIPLMEDIELSRRLKRVGQLACLRARVTTSARRWQRDGLVRTIVLMWALRLAYFLGVPSERLKTFYADTR